MYLLALKYIIIGTGLIVWLGIIVALGFGVFAAVISLGADYKYNKEMSEKDKMEKLAEEIRLREREK